MKMKYVEILLGVLLVVGALIFLMESITRVDFLAHAEAGREVFRQITMKDYSLEDWLTRGGQGAVLVVGVILAGDGIRRLFQKRGC